MVQRNVIKMIKLLTKQIFLLFLSVALLSFTACLVSNDEVSYTDTDGEGEMPSPAVLSVVEVDGGKREYEIGEEFDYETLVVTLVDKTEKILAKDEYEIDYSSFKNSVPGVYSIIVSYRELQTEYTVKVKRDEENGKVWGKDMWL